jgi:hypothetical protein
MPLLAELASAPVLQPHVLQAERTRLPFEALFRSLLRHLSDVALAEEAFGRRFFGEREARDVLQQLLQRPVAAALGFLDEHLPQHFDSPGLLLVVALVSAQWAASAARGSSCLDGFFLRAIEAARKRFRFVFDANVASLKACAAAPRRALGAFDAAPHAVTRRFAEWTGSTLLLHRAIAHPSAQDQMLLAHVAAVAREADALWAKMGAELAQGGGAGAGAGGRGALARAALLLNQHACVLQVYQALGVAAQDCQAPAEAQARALVAYVDEAVDGAHFKVYASWVKKVEAAARAGTAFAPSVLPTGVPAFLPEGRPAVGSIEAAEAEAVAKDFSLTWRGGLSALNDDVGRFFGGAGAAAAAPAPAAVPASSAAAAAAARQQLAMAVLVAVFTRVAELHQRFQAIVARALPQAGFAKDIVGLQVVYAEARRYGK